MADKMKYDDKDKSMGIGKQQGGQKAPGRDVDDRSKERGSKGTEREHEREFNPEDRERKAKSGQQRHDMQKP